VVNPLDPTRIPGGSSGGSAVALAIGACDVALGSDSGGSIRVPAACCGVVGFKPTHGRVSTAGLFPLAPSYDHAGPMARTVQECVDAMHILDPTLEDEQLELDHVEIGAAWLEQAEPGVRARVQEAAGRFPRRRGVDLPLPEGTTPVFMREAASTHRELFDAHRDLYGATVRAKLEWCFAVTDDEYEEALAARAAYVETAREALADLDLLAVPTLPFVAPRAGQPETELRWSVIRLTYPLNVLGWPALALPCGLAEDGLPASITLVGPPGADARVLAAGLALERALSPF
jgi:Asp-tRNA(Asn)/Glu-tRNA(Gln) amidotransferase A subunit family amidase